MKMKQSKRARITIIVISSVVAFFSLLGCALMTYASFYYAAVDVDESLTSHDGVSVSQEKNGTWDFVPESTVKEGFVFYPGAQVESTAYAPLAFALAQKGFATFLIKMPLNFAFFDVNAADAVISAHPEITSWGMMGHSLGGAMMGQYLAKNASQYNAAVFLASYSMSDLSTTSLKCFTLIGSNDKVVNQQNLADCQANLPGSGMLLVLGGGNHAGFGSYGEQRGDGVSSLPKGSQIETAAEDIAAFYA